VPPTTTAVQSPVRFVYCITLSRRCAASAVRVPSTNPATTIPARTTGAVIPLVVAVIPLVVVKVEVGTPLHGQRKPSASATTSIITCTLSTKDHSTIKIVIM